MRLGLIKVIFIFGRRSGTVVNAAVSSCIEMSYKTMMKACQVFASLSSHKDVFKPPKSTSGLLVHALFSFGSHVFIIRFEHISHTQRYSSILNFKAVD